MEQQKFNKIQDNFRKFLSGQLHPSINKSIIPENSPSPIPKCRIEKIEKTYSFGRDDGSLGYKISWMDKNGNLRYKIIPT